ncbi:hypothetical protein VTO42DRAFT_6739 [Malbranchea cinnamomea]
MWISSFLNSLTFCWPPPPGIGKMQSDPRFVDFIRFKMSSKLSEGKTSRDPFSCKASNGFMRFDICDNLPMASSDPVMHLNAVFIDQPASFGA